MKIEEADNCKESLISLTKDFVEFLDILYTKGKINKEQYEDMTKIKKGFLENFSE